MFSKDVYKWVGGSVLGSYFVSEPKMKAKKSIIGSAFMIDSYIYEELKLKSTGVRENKKNI